jgi:hypothetical protein
VLPLELLPLEPVPLEALPLLELPLLEPLLEGWPELAPEPLPF